MKRQLFFALFLLFTTKMYAQDYHWAKNGKCEDNSWGLAVASDNNGNQVFAESFYISTIFDGSEYIAVEPSPGEWPYGNDFLIILTDSLGNVVWVNQMGSDEDYLGDDVTSLQFDRNGDILATGEFSDVDVYLNGEFLETREYSGFVMKFRKTGELDWIRYTNATLTALDIDGDNNIYATGYFMKESYYGDDTLHGADQGTTKDMCIYKLDTDGNLIWSNHAGTPPGMNAHNNFVYGYDVAVNSNDDVIVTGVFDPGNGTNKYIYFDEIVIYPDEGERNGFIATLDHNGAFVRVEDRMREIREIEIDSDDNIMVAGEYRLTMQNDFVDITEEYYDSYLYLMKLSPGYQLSWFERSNTEIGTIRDMDIDENGRPDICVRFKNYLNINDTILSASGEATAIFNYKADGALNWVARVPGSGSWQSYISCGPGQSIAYTGRLSHVGVFGDYVLTTDENGSEYFISLMAAPGSTPFGIMSNELTNNSLVHIWPNPTKGVFYCDIASFSNIRVFNMEGAEVNAKYTAFEDYLKIELSDPVPGVYFVIYYQGKSRSGSKIVVD